MYGMGLSIEMSHTNPFTRFHPIELDGTANQRFACFVMKICGATPKKSENQGFSGSSNHNLMKITIIHTIMPSQYWH